ncbi:MAG: Zn-ribbon domain-containing OB-fold protein [Deltaproteobacteria bacterium]|nr:Zn-ribbon domain-containing OB-fold protein [Deltaproteobacteria bacterium]
MKKDEQREELLSVPIDMNLEYRFPAGVHYGRFYREMKETGKIMGVRCPKCKRVLVPPRPVCGECYEKTGEWVAVGPKGTVMAYTSIYFPFIDGSTGKPRPLPYGAGLIQLDGAYSTINHFLEEGDPEKLYIGMRVEAVFKEKREGNIGDIICFKTIND